MGNELENLKKTVGKIVNLAEQAEAQAIKLWGKDYANKAPYGLCPECGEPLEGCIAVDPTTDKAHDGVRCPEGCQIG